VLCVDFLFVFFALFFGFLFSFFECCEFGGCWGLWLICLVFVVFVYFGLGSNLCNGKSKDRSSAKEDYRKKAGELTDYSEVIKGERAG